uniref:Uncharacterized protein n=1 Tax=Globisporangium ultimum (strain ATCC 200006 / CBS 805.95 / DAOM BR144) TaxID=431595 RepID=K3WYS1_GLOUD
MPFELLWKSKPFLSHMCVLGSRGYVYVDRNKQTKLVLKAYNLPYMECLKRNGVSYCGQLH